MVLNLGERGLAIMVELVATEVVLVVVHVLDPEVFWHSLPEVTRWTVITESPLLRTRTVLTTTGFVTMTAWHLLALGMRLGI